MTLPERSLDLVFMRNATHDIDNRMAYFRKFKVMLKPEGRIAIIDWRKGVSQEQLEEEMKEVGYRLIGALDFLPEQFFMIFSL
ncbi:MAG: methyltransferase domain-containing protein [Candidatus Bathyarchaeota archaeon]|nr:methyltransferase domain-containing protein [Candidatus Bathyarchaeota archaeon]